MATINDKLAYLEETKTAIKDAIVTKGVEVSDTDTFRSYATAIENIESGGGETIVNQTKSIEINANGETTVSYDEGYTGLESVVITTNVPTSTGDCTAALCFDGLGYDAPPAYLTESVAYSETIKQNYTDTSNYKDDTDLVFFPNIDLSTNTNISNMFEGCSNLEYVPIINTPRGTINRMFYNCKKLKSIGGLNVQYDGNINSNSVFYYCQSLTKYPTVNYENFNELANWFYYCNNIDDDFIYEKELKVTDASNLFNNNIKLKHVSLNAPQLSNMANMFEKCNNMILDKLICGKITSMNYAFYNNSPNLIDIDVDFDTSSINSSSGFSAAFNNKNIQRVKSVDLSGFTGNNFQLYYFSGFGTSGYNYRSFTLKGIGTYVNTTTFNADWCTTWGIDSETITDARQSLVDSLLTYSYDRATAGYAVCTITLSEESKAVLTEEEIAAITSKGYSIS